MPIYEYLCTECEDSFEQIMSFAAVQDPACPSCGSGQTRRKLSAPAIHFKAGGFYLTDSRKEAEARNGEKKKEKSESKAAEGESSEVKGQDSGGDKESGGNTKSDSGNREKKATKKVSDKAKAAATHD